LFLDADPSGFIPLFKVSPRSESKSAFLTFDPDVRILNFYATLPYIRHFIFADCYDNNHWYLEPNLAGHLELAGFYFSKCPANSKCPAKFVIHLVMEETQV
jgi:hypothetical protein